MVLVKELNLEEKTILVFSSDNGPLYNRLGATDTDFFESANGFRGRKGSLYEGGVRVPMIIRWKGRIRPGTVSDRITGFEDWMPTILELVGADDAPPKSIDGISFAPTLLGRKQKPRPFLYREFAAYGGQQSVRVGDWKGIRQNLSPPAKNKNAAPNLHIELYDLKKDIGETEDLAASYPDIVAKIERIMRQQHKKSQLFPFAALDRP
jgi:arylsulfatase